MTQFNKKWRTNLANIENDTTGIVFYLAPSIYNHYDTMVELSVRKAVKDWACQTKINIKVGGYTTLDYDSIDQVSVIHLVNSFPNPATIGRTSQYFIWCKVVNGDTIHFAKEIDIAIKKNPNTGIWHYDTTGALPALKQDFFETILHELGHVNLLRHVNYNDLMFYTTQFDAINPIPAANRRSITSTDAYGGVDVVDRSISIQLSSNCGYHTATLSEFSCGDNSVKGNFLDVIGEFQLYPNPFSYNGINISYQLNRSTLLQYTIIDFTGKEVYRSSKLSKQKGSYNEHINTGHLAPGIYLFIINYNGYTKAFKIINQ